MSACRGAGFCQLMPCVQFVYAIFQCSNLTGILLSFFFRIGEILLSTAVTQNTGLGRAVYVEDCSCPTGYTGLSCEVKLCPSFLRMGYTSCPTGYSSHFWLSFISVQSAVASKQLTL